MKTILVSLISEQTIPNLQFIKENKVDGYVFVSTDSMNKRGILNGLLSTAKIDTDSENVKIITVNAFSYDDITQKLSDVVNDEDKYLVNLTGGTKIMSLAVNDFFKEINAELYYLTGANEYIKLFPGRNKPVFELESQISLEEYLNAYGFEVVNKGTLLHDKETAQKLFSYFIQNFPNPEDVNVLDKLRPLRDNKKVERNEIVELDRFLEKIQYKTIDGNFTKYDVRYLTGDWLEEYVYYIIKEGKNISEKQIGTGWILRKDNTNNEFDVVYLENNSLKIIECKTSIFMDLEEKKTFIGETIYKADSLRNKLGLFTKTHIVTLSKTGPENEISGSLKTNLKRADASKVTVIGKESMNQVNDLLKRI